MIEELTIKVDADADHFGKHKVVLDFREFTHRDKFDVESDFHREAYLTKMVHKIAKCLGKEYQPSISFENANHDPDAKLREALKQKLVDALDDATNGTQSAWQPSVITAASVQPVKAEWFMPGWIPAGSISVNDGDPGLGKSQLALDISARCTRGDCMPPQNAPDGTHTPGNVLITNAEDDHARVIVPRLIAAGADLDRVHLLREMNWDGTESRLLSLPGDLPNIEQYILDHKIVLWSLDPFVAFIDGSLSINNDADVRRCLGQVAAMAERTGVAVLLVRHLNKKSGSHAIYRGGGSIGITGAARSVFMVGKDPDDPNCRILASVKSNLCEAPKSLRFHIESYGDTSRIAWNGGDCDLQANDLLGEHKANRTNKKQKAEEIITEVLGNGPRGESEVLAACEDAGISAATCWRARKSMGVVSEKSGYQGLWMLSLPTTNGHYPEFDDEF